MGEPNNEEKLYAGKFKTVEELEAGYKNSLPTFQENENLKKRLEEITAVPSDYINPSDIELDENRVSDIKARAKEAGLTQAQYEKLVAGDKRRVEDYKKNFETAKKEVGEETINVLKDYVSKHYPKELQDGILNTLIGNKEARQSALNHRQQLLSNKVPGVGKPSYGNYNVTQEDIDKAYVAKEKNRGNIKARDHYLNLIAMKANQEAS